MTETARLHHELLQENLELRRQLDEANLINAFRNGEDDAFLMPEDEGGKIYVLEGADQAYRHLVETMHEGCVTVSFDGNILFSNKNFADMINTPLQYLMGQSIYRFLSSSDREFLSALLNSSQDHFKTELILNTENGLDVPVLMSASFCHDGSDAFVHMVVTDLTELKSFNRLNTLVFEQVASSIIICDQIGKVVKENPAARKLFGESLSGEIFDRVVPLYSEDTGTRFLVQKAIKNGPVRGHEVIFNKNLHLVVNAGYLQGRQTTAGGFLISILDMTENHRYRQEILRLDRLNLVGEMAAGIGHEVRNPMTTVRGYLQMFSCKDQFTEYKDSIEVMIEEIDRANSIITEFLSLAKTKKIVKEEINFNDIIKKIIPLVEVDALRQGLEIKMELQEVPNIWGDEKEIRQCILNLVKNGLEAMSEGGTVTVKTYLMAGQIILEVQDQGCGIPLEVQSSMGTPFMTTKERGTGLGLSVCFSIAKRHGAVLDFQTDRNGTSFYFRCPSICQDTSLL